MCKLIFLKCKKYCEVNKAKVCVKDVADILCLDSNIEEGVGEIELLLLEKPGERRVINILLLLRSIQQAFPGYQMECMEESDMIVEWKSERKGQNLRILLVCFVSFFGTAFTIMAFHNDIGIRNVFREVYYFTGGEQSEGLGVLEISYSLGLFLGINLFFNHLGKKKITIDPTPIQVAMNNYEKDVNQSIIETADREGEMVDV